MRSELVEKIIASMVGDFVCHDLSDVDIAKKRMFKLSPSSIIFRAVMSEHSTVYFTIGGLFAEGPKKQIVDDLKNWLLAGNAPDRFSGFKDKNGIGIYENDICISHKERVKSDYVPKKYPQDKIEIVCRVVFESGEFTIQYVCNCKKHLGIDQNIYRCYSYWPHPTPIGMHNWNPITRDWDIPADGMTCNNIEIVGNVHQNPEMLEEGVL
jgi:hypothetical protein